MSITTGFQLWGMSPDCSTIYVNQLIITNITHATRSEEAPRKLLWIIILIRIRLRLYNWNILLPMERMIADYSIANTENSCKGVKMTFDTPTCVNYKRGIRRLHCVTGCFDIAIK